MKNIEENLSYIQSFENRLKLKSHILLINRLLLKLQDYSDIPENIINMINAYSALITDTFRITTCINERSEWLTKYSGHVKNKLVEEVLKRTHKSELVFKESNRYILDTAIKLIEEIVILRTRMSTRFTDDDPLIVMLNHIVDLVGYVNIDNLSEEFNLIEKSLNNVFESIKSINDFKIVEVDADYMRYVLMELQHIRYMLKTRINRAEISNQLM